MPIFELECRACSAQEERYFRRWDDPAVCLRCGGAMTKLPGRFGVPLSGSLSKYMDHNREGGHAEGFYGYRKLSSISGQPEPVWLSTMEEVREFNKAEGLAAPGEVPSNCTISADGRRITSDGMPGTWGGGAIPALPARLREMLAKPDEAFQSPPATATPAMPLDYGMKVEVVEAPAEVGG